MAPYKVKTYEKKDRSGVSNSRSVDAFNALLAENLTKRILGRKKKRKLKVKELPPRAEPYLTDDSLKVTRPDTTFDKLLKGKMFNKVEVMPHIKVNNATTSDSDASKSKLPHNIIFSPIMTRRRRRNVPAVPKETFKEPPSSEDISFKRSKHAYLDEQVDSSCISVEKEKENKKVTFSSLRYANITTAAPQKQQEGKFTPTSKMEASYEPVFSDTFRERQTVHSSTPYVPVMSNKIVADPISPILSKSSSSSSSNVIEKSYNEIRMWETSFPILDSNATPKIVHNKSKSTKKTRGRKLSSVQEPEEDKREDHDWKLKWSPKVHINASDLIKNVEQNKICFKGFEESEQSTSSGESKIFGSRCENYYKEGVKKPTAEKSVKKISATSLKNKVIRKSVRSLRNSKIKAPVESTNRKPKKRGLNSKENKKNEPESSEESEEEMPRNRLRYVKKNPPPKTLKNLRTKICCKTSKDLKNGRSKILDDKKITKPCSVNLEQMRRANKDSSQEEDSGNKVLLNKHFTKETESEVTAGSDKVELSTSKIVVKRTKTGRLLRSVHDENQTSLKLRRSVKKLNYVQDRNPRSPASSIDHANEQSTRKLNKRGRPKKSLLYSSRKKFSTNSSQSENFVTVRRCVVRNNNKSPASSVSVNKPRKESLRRLKRHLNQTISIDSSSTSTNNFSSYHTEDLSDELELVLPKASPSKPKSLKSDDETDNQRNFTFSLQDFNNFVDSYNGQGESYVSNSVSTDEYNASESLFDYSKPSCISEEHNYSGQSPKRKIVSPSSSPERSLDKPKRTSPRRCYVTNRRLRTFPDYSGNEKMHHTRGNSRKIKSLNEYKNQAGDVHKSPKADKSPKVLVEPVIDLTNDLLESPQSRRKQALVERDERTMKLSPVIRRKPKIVIVSNIQVSFSREKIRRSIAHDHSYNFSPTIQNFHSPKRSPKNNLAIGVHARSPIRKLPLGANRSISFLNNTSSSSTNKKDKSDKCTICSIDDGSVSMVDLSSDSSKNVPDNTTNVVETSVESLGGTKDSVTTSNRSEKLSAIIANVVETSLRGRVVRLVCSKAGLSRASASSANVAETSLEDSVKSLEDYADMSGRTTKIVETSLEDSVMSLENFEPAINVIDKTTILAEPSSEDYEAASADSLTNVSDGSTTSLEDFKAASNRACAQNISDNTASVAETSLNDSVKSLGGFKASAKRAKRRCNNETMEESSIILRPGKLYRRSLSLLRRSKAVEKECPPDCICIKCNFRKRLDLNETRQIVSIRDISLDSSILELYAKRKSSYVPEAQELIDTNLDDSLRSLSLTTRKSLVENQDNSCTDLPVVTAKDIVLRRCGQADPVPFEECYPRSLLQNCQKIGEGVFGEVFLYRNPNGGTTVMKVIPIEGDQIVNGERQKRFDEILSEIVIAMELSNLRNNKNNCTTSFSEVQKVNCVQGLYPERLVDLWDLYDENRQSENDSPTMFTEDQTYIVLELANGGSDLESFVFNNAQQVLSIFKQTACALAVAERQLKFEHRDLHWGNVLINSVDKNKTIRYRINGEDLQVASCGVEVAIIDFTLSRVEFDGVVIYNDLGLDKELFTATGDYQFQVYRLMQKANDDEWQHFEPYSNILWLHYILDKINFLHYKNRKSKIHQEALKKLEKISKDILVFSSVGEFVMRNFCTYNSVY